MLTSKSRFSFLFIPGVYNRPPRIQLLAIGVFRCFFFSRGESNQTLLNINETEKWKTDNYCKIVEEKLVLRRLFGVVLERGDVMGL